MDVHVHRRRIDFDIQHGKGKTALGNLRLVGVVDGLGQHFIADAAPIDEQCLPLASALEQGGLTDEAGDFKLRVGEIHLE